MIRILKKKVWCLPVLILAGLLCASVPYAAEIEDTSSEMAETVWETEEAAVAVESVVEELAEAAEAVTPDGNSGLIPISNEDLDALKQKIDNIDMDKLKADLRAVTVLLKSEEFQHLLSYEEVQDLLKMILMKARNFLYEEPDLSEKILETIGLEETYAKIILQMTNTALGIADEVSGSIGEDELQAVTEVANDMMKDPETREMVADLVKTVEGYINE